MEWPYFKPALFCFIFQWVQKEGSTIPILDYHHVHDPIIASHYANPLTQILMLTAIVVGVATLGLGLTLARKIYSQYSTFNEDEIIAKLKDSDD